MLKRRRQSSIRRLMHSTGHNISVVGVPEKSTKYLSDFFTTLIDIQWRWIILLFVSGFVAAWFLFACVYYSFCYLHGDFEPGRPRDWVPCAENIKSFTSAYLFSIETISTIGYGSRMQTEACPGFYLLVMFQSIIGAGMQFVLASLFVSKISRAKRRPTTIIFSDKVCIYEQDTALKVAVRVGDMRKSEITGAHAQGFLVKQNQTKDGGLVPVRMFNVRFTGECGKDLIFFPWPTQLLHTVDKHSPLWTLSRDMLLHGEYELIVVIDGVCGAISKPFQARKSYRSHEMRWAQRFADLNFVPESSGKYTMDLSNFHETVPASTPLCSAQDITNLRESYRLSENKVNDPGDQQPKPRSRRLSIFTTTSSQSLLCPQRSKSVGETNQFERPAKTRRFSLGDMIRGSQGRGASSCCSIDDVVNRYRHRLSVTDTYLGVGIEEEEEEGDKADEVEINSLTIQSLISQHSEEEKHKDVRDVFKRRNHSVPLLFAPKPATVDKRLFKEI